MTTTQTLGTYATDAPVTVAQGGDTYTRSAMHVAECADCAGTLYASAAHFACRTADCGADVLAAVDIYLEHDEIATIADNGALVVWHYDLTTVTEG